MANYTVLGGDISKRFWSKVNILSDDECWEWKAGIKSTGRGNFSIGRKTIQAHRMSWILTYGDIPDNMLVCHTCDNGLCVNPKHFFLGTHKDNTLDMIQKGRKVTLKGDADPKSKLTSEQVLFIRSNYKPKDPNFNQKALAKFFSVSRSTIQAIINHRNWSHL